MLVWGVPSFVRDRKGLNVSIGLCVCGLPGCRLLGRLRMWQSVLCCPFFFIFGEAVQYTLAEAGTKEEFCKWNWFGKVFPTMT